MRDNKLFKLLFGRTSEDNFDGDTNVNVEYCYPVRAKWRYDEGLITHLVDRISELENKVEILTTKKTKK